MATPVLMKLVQLLTNCHREKSTEPILQSKGVDDKTKTQLTAFLAGRLEEEKLPISWKVEVIVSNDYVQKSLHPVVEMNVDGEKFELDLDGLAGVRLALAKALLNTDKYQ